MIKLKKFYVNFDDAFLFCVNARNEEEACVKTLKAYNLKDNGGSSSFDTVTMPTRFIVNEQGFETHDHDKIFAATKIEELLRKEK